MPEPESRRPRSLRDRKWPFHACLRREVALTVPFQDADPTGVAWHGNYFRYFDKARVALLQWLDFDYQAMARLGQHWPIIDTRVRYLRSVTFGDELRVSAELVEWAFRLVIFYEIRNAQGRCINEAYTVQVPVDADSQALILGTPAVLTARIESRIRQAQQRRT